MTSQLIAFEPTVVVTDSEHMEAAVRIAMFNSKLKVSNRVMLSEYPILEAQGHESRDK